MKPEELRIGNWVNYNGHVVRVDQIIAPQPSKDERYANKWIVGVYMNTLDVLLEDISPIPLTEEILEKCGFVDVEELKNVDWKQYRMFNNYSIALQFPLGVECHFYAGNYPIAIKHLHQLQNLYYALTGEELNIEL